MGEGAIKKIANVEENLQELLEAPAFLMEEYTWQLCKSKRHVKRLYQLPAVYAKCVVLFKAVS